MNMLPALAQAFGVEPAALERLVDAYENPDRLALVEARWREAGCGDADKGWLIEELRRRAAAVELVRELAKWGCLFDDGEIPACPHNKQLRRHEWCLPCRADALAGEPGEAKHPDVFANDWDRARAGIDPTVRGERSSGAEVARIYSAAEVREAFVAGMRRMWSAGDYPRALNNFREWAKAEALRLYPDVPPAPKAGEEGR